MNLKGFENFTDLEKIKSERLDMGDPDDSFYRPRRATGTDTSEYVKIDVI